jgi:hypothetical protein
VLDFGPNFFTQLGLRPAKVASETAVALQPGMAVAQVDCDSQGHAQVVWTKIDTIYSQNNLLLMQVQHFIELGTSGGAFLSMASTLAKIGDPLLKPIN